MRATRGMVFFRAIFFMCAAFLIAGCAAPPRMSVLIRMIKPQEDYFTNTIIADFNTTHHAAVSVVHYEQTDALEAEIKAAAPSVGLVKIPFDKCNTLIARGLLKPLDSILTPAELADFKKTYLLTSLGRSKDLQYLVPRKFETRLMVYSKSKVADAVASWRAFKDSIDAALKPCNGYGLPSTYMLKSDPNQWDFYDLFVVGWVWAHTVYDGVKCPRIANRGKRYSGTSLGVIDRVYSLKGDSTAMLRLQGDAVVDAFHWEALYAACNIYNKKMWTEAWSGTEIWKGFQSEEVFLSFMTQLDCFFIHGTGQDDLEGYLKVPDDLGVATMPAGCSVELDEHGMVRRAGCKSITTGGWWWGIPATTPHPRLSYELAMAITNTQNQIQESSRFGMIPVRKDILGDMSMLYGGGWITRIYEASLQQLIFNKYTTIPGNAHFDRIGGLYLDAWYDIVVDRNWSGKSLDFPNRAFIQKLLEEKYAPQAQKILSEP
ncbi:MAG: extracellular solute-binding protein [Chitinivibrionales bacterium]|nr:extracellular solute-binding protein [Chitinivibrionales bacterium]